MTDLALHRPVQAGMLVEGGGVVITALPIERLTLAQASSGAQTGPDSALPEQPNRVSGGAGFRALWLRLGGRLLVSEADDAAPGAPLPASLRVTDVSHAWAGFRISGPHARDLLARGTPLDLRPTVFADGQCARTWCAGFTIVVEVVGDDLIVRADVALAEAFADWLRDAAAGFARSE